ncbi:uncharacterized protein LOC130647440 [Hydractinia symbiolongicarpus]|uniref:uncharacterized protein LOC130647440 n=1 Tax=Hydractinia symbiolongicarpus TaxID=13093 RepID=UPI00254ED858|nr:uncharacterized protein LOC130647440 [Hydractinia symbiolongicarpus]
MAIILYYLNDVSTSFQSFVYSAYTISILCLLLTLLIYAVNMKQLNMVLQKVKHPLKKERAVFICNVTAHLIQWQVSAAVFILRGHDWKLNNTSSFVLSIFIMYGTVAFYCWSLSLKITTIYLVKYHRKMSRTWKFKSTYFWAFCYVIPIIFALIAFLAGYYREERRLTSFTVYNRYAKWMLVSFEVITTTIMIVILVYTFKARITTLQRLKCTKSEILRKLLDAQSLRNGIVFRLVISVMVILELIVVVRGEKVSAILSGVFVVLHSFLGVYFLTFETIFNDKDLRKPFRFQRQRNALKSTHLRINSWRRFRQRNNQGSSKQPVETNDTDL